MKKAIIFIVVLLGLLVVLANNYRYRLFDAAIAFESEKGNLLQKSIVVEVRHWSYLENEPLTDGSRLPKETLVLIHGFSAYKENWLRFAVPLTDHYHIIAVDLPGHGESFKDLSLDHKLENQVRLLQGLFRKLQLERFHIIGNSMGGAISVLYAAESPAQVASVVLIDPAGVDEYDSEFFQLQKQGKNIFFVTDYTSFRELVDFVMVDPPFIPWPVSAVQAERTTENIGMHRKIFQDVFTVPNNAVLDALPKMESPVLVIWGKQDRVTHVDNARVFKKLLPESTLELIDDVGHVPMIEVPELTASLVKTFLEGNLEEVKDDK